MGVQSEDQPLNHPGSAEMPESAAPTMNGPPIYSSLPNIPDDGDRKISESASSSTESCRKESVSEDGTNRKDSETSYVSLNHTVSQVELAKLIEEVMIRKSSSRKSSVASSTGSRKTSIQSMTDVGRATQGMESVNEVCEDEEAEDRQSAILEILATVINENEAARKSDDVNNDNGTNKEEVTTDQETHQDMQENENGNGNCTGDDTLPENDNEHMQEDGSVQDVDKSSNKGSVSSKKSEDNSDKKIESSE